MAIKLYYYYYYYYYTTPSFGPGKTYKFLPQVHLIWRRRPVKVTYLSIASISRCLSGSSDAMASLK